MSDSANKFTITGKVHAIPPPRDGKYHSIVVKIEDGKYPQLVPFDCKAETSASVSVGDEVKVHFGLSGREWTKGSTGEVKYFGSAWTWKVDVVGRGSAEPPPPAFGDDQDIPF